jgi:hypothetical protein
MRDDNAFIKVIVTEEGGKITYGTAYRINNKYAITAMHVVTKYKSIRFEFECGKKSEKFIPEYENEDFDIAIISFPPDVLETLTEVPRIQITSSAGSNIPWEGMGYPKYAEENGERSGEELQGKCEHCNDKKNYFGLKCDTQPKIQEWGGVSGAPVFVNNKLAGVIATFDSDTENTQFCASAIWKINDGRFSVFFQNKEITTQVKKEILDWLKEDKQKDLSELLKNNNEDITVTLNRLTSQKLPLFLNEVKRLKKVKKNPRSLLTEFSRRVLPLYFIDNAVILDKELMTNRTEATFLNCATEVAAECSVAALANRPINVNKEAGILKGAEKLYVSKGKFALAPELGFESYNASMEAFTQDVLSSNALDDYLLKQFSSGGIKSKNIVNANLSDHKNNGNYYYLVVQLDESKDDYKDKIETIRGYRTQFPDLIIINLTTDIEIAELEEVDLMIPLRHVLEVEEK